jgi:hypothetical protein
MPHSTSQQSPDLTQLLSEVQDVERQANNPDTREFLEAGKRLLRRDLLRSSREAADAKGQPPFEEVLAWLTFRRVVSEAQHTTPNLTLAALRYRWRTKAGYLRDLVIAALSPRMERPNAIQYARQMTHEIVTGDRRPANAIAEIMAAEVQILKDDHAFRLQMIFQATLAHDPQVADTLRRIDDANVNAWAEFLRQTFDELGLKLRGNLDFTQLSCALHAACQGVMFRSMLPSRPGAPSPLPADLLSLIGTALMLAAVDLGDGQNLDDFYNEMAKAVLAPPS